MSGVWRLLFRWEHGYKVWTYEPLLQRELYEKRQEGWKLCQQ
ncbi:hypothetical protein GGGNBK_21545 [Sporosarcina sp. ANT_H38]